MWLYTHSTQKPAETSLDRGSVSFLSEYVGVGQFEARLFIYGSEVPIARQLFKVTR